ncbi:hypothetical protein HDV03_003012 [Kappamyces sp. JEL0829]|nr:hypothetical protein HDV03_003012 [Kappamyces sp. JEL0829]
MHPPSIPTRFQTIYYDDRENKAFNSTTRRFDCKMSDLPGAIVSLTPGPGYYAKAAEKLEHAFKELSLSKKGFGGFASQRFKNSLGVIDPFSTVSPAKYNPTTPVYSASLTTSLSPAFRNPVLGAAPIAASAVYVRTKTGLKATPGPGEYSTKSDKAQMTNGAQSVFKSKTSRTLNETKTVRPRSADSEPPGERSTADWQRRLDRAGR